MVHPAVSIYMHDSTGHVTHHQYTQSRLIASLTVEIWGKKINKYVRVQKLMAKVHFHFSLVTFVVENKFYLSK